MSDGQHVRRKSNVTKSIIAIAMLWATPESLNAPRTMQGATCPWGEVEIVKSAARADYVVRSVSSAAKSDCVIEWTEYPARAGQWRLSDGLPDFRVYFTTGIADLAIFEI